MKNNPLFKNGCTGMVLFIILGMVFLFSSLSLSLWTQVGPGEDKAREKQHEPIVEKVIVTNIEVPVRVFRDGQLVTDLTREDFTLYENKKKMEINGFFLKRKIIKVNETPGGTENPDPAKSQPRTFVLVFSVTDFNEHLEKAVEHLFGKIFKTQDRLLVFANDKTLEYPNLRDIDSAKQRLLTDLKEESMKARHRLTVYINEVQTYVNTTELKLQSPTSEKPSVKIHNFLKRYAQAWKDYKQKYLTPNIDRFYFFSRYLENIKGEKWVLNFYQFDLFPNIRLNSELEYSIRTSLTAMTESRDYGDHAISKLCTELLEQIQLEMSAGQGFPAEDIAKLFYKVDATFHSFFIKTMNKDGSEDYEYQELASDIEETLRQITDITGGVSITSNDLVQSLETVSELEDAYYILTYAPLDPKNTGPLKIKVKGKGYEVFYDDNFRANYIEEYLKKNEEQVKTPDIKIVGFSFQGKILAFSVKDFLVKTADNKTIGQMKVRIRLANRDNNTVVFDQEKVLTAQKAEMKVSLGNFKTLGKGEYNFLIDAVDLFTGKESNFQQNILVE